MIRKVPGQAEAQKAVAFPYEAMEEAVVNAVYHRSYDGVFDPIKVYLYPDRLEIISYPGPVSGLELHHFQRGASLPPVPNRNRRIGEFLKDLRLAEGRGTGIPKIRRKMIENGSPEPAFEFDGQRTYFRVILPAHPQYIVIHALREAAHFWAVGERENAILTLETAAKHVPKSGALLAQLIEYKASMGDDAAAERLFKDNADAIDRADRNLPFITMAKVYLDKQDPKRALEILAKAPPPMQIDDIVELAVLHKRAGRLEKAHKIFAYNYNLIKNDPKALHEFAGTKMKLAGNTRDRHARKRLNQEAVELLRRVLQLSDDKARNAWCWMNLAQTLAWLHAPKTEILQAYSKAMELLPDEPRFAEWYKDWMNRSK